jgi:hypothetical protein
MLMCVDPPFARARLEIDTDDNPLRQGTTDGNLCLSDRPLMRHEALAGAAITKIVEPGSPGAGAAS